MNDNDSSPFEPVTDASTEARIVAWVLGELSPFEASELERICAEDRGLEIFHRRMMALHGLLVDAENTGADEDWKLSDHRHAHLNDAFGKDGPVAPAAVVLPKRRPQLYLWQKIAGAAACFVSAFVIWKMSQPDENRVASAARGKDPMSPRFEETAETSSALSKESTRSIPTTRSSEKVDRSTAASVPEKDREDYLIAKQELETQEQLLNTMKLKGTTEKVSGGVGTGFREVARARAVTPAPAAIAAPAAPAVAAPADPAIVPANGLGEGMGSGKGDAIPYADDSVAAGKKTAILDSLETGNVVRQPFAADVGSERRLAKDEKPPQVDLEEISTAKEAFSTFSLSVSDVSFRLAARMLAQGQRPDAASVKVEQFYNAVDYGDPTPVTGEPVAGVVEQSAHPVLPGRNLVRLGVRVGATGRSIAQPLRLTLLIDQSGSMARDDRKAAMEKAMTDLSKLVTAADRISVIGFSRKPVLIGEDVPGNQLPRLLASINQEASEGGTNLEEALKFGRQIANRHQVKGAQCRVVLFTDGAANLGDADPQQLAAQVGALRQGGIAFDVAGIGADDLNDHLLAELARNGNGRYYLATDDLAAQLAGAFRPAAEDTKVQVVFNAERVSRYKLIGFEENRLNKEDFRDDAVDGGELAAAESAVALYQVETIPNGSGEIGEMRVRFREANSGSTVERAWTIPYNPAVPAFDRAPASLQLAGLSMMAAEKLKGGPLADAINFKNFTGPLTQVRKYYAGSRKAFEMLRTIEWLKR